MMERSPEELTWLEPRRLLFLCYGNICRSPFTQALWNHQGGPIAADSAGFIRQPGRLTPSNFRQMARDYSVSLEGHRAQWVSPDLIERADAILVMDRDNLAQLTELYPESLDKVFALGQFHPHPRLEIDDPYGLSQVDAKRVYEQIFEAVRGLRDSLG